jgi:UDP-2-acetamido-4-(D-alanylamino)-2,4,6-trideoxy-alpha-D-mannopyranose hydrolase
VKTWQSTLLPPTASIRDAMRAIDRGSLRIALIADAENKLLGTATDGDVRRALLRDANMEDPVSKVMNIHPVVAFNQNISREHCLTLMSQHELMAIPIIDDLRKIVGLETLHHAMQPERHDNPVFIMAGGFGTRLQPLTDHCPKPMLRVGEKPMLEHLIDQFVSHGFYNFYISTHYLPEVIRNHFGDGSTRNISIRYVHEDTPLGTGGALGLLPKGLGDLPLIMMNGDVLTKLDYAKLLRHHETQRFDATVCVREDEHRVPFGVIETEQQLITNMVEKPTYRYKINTGIYVLNPEVVTTVRQGQHIDMPALLEQYRADQKRIGTYTCYDYWLDIGQMKDYQKAQSDIHIYFKSPEDNIKL